MVNAVNLDPRIAANSTPPPSRIDDRMDTLFDLDEPRTFDRDRLRDRLAELAARGVYIGGSSWKYEGWLNQIYSRFALSGARKVFEETLRDSNT